MSDCNETRASATAASRDLTTAELVNELRAELSRQRHLRQQAEDVADELRKSASVGAVERARAEAELRLSRGKRGTWRDVGSAIFDCFTNRILGPHGISLDDARAEIANAIVSDPPFALRLVACGALPWRAVRLLLMSRHGDIFPNDAPPRSDWAPSGGWQRL